MLPGRFCSLKNFFIKDNVKNHKMKELKNNKKTKLVKKI